ncbi:MAG: arginine deiminase family protein [Acidobacteria bacterium]|nr:arginine deiminase family protein [Acidobacteriota bacterium]
MEQRMFSKAIVRRPGVNFVEGVTSAKLGKPSFQRALQQHEKYWRALEVCGLRIILLEAEPRFPDSTFVEDVAVLTDRGAILTRPGAESRRGEVAAIRDTLAGYFPAVREIESPGTLDGGDICQAGNHFFIGISKRTNKEGARQLAQMLQHEGFTTAFVNIKGTRGILHLKSGIAYLGDNRLALIGELAGREVFAEHEIVPVTAGETYAANCVRVNDWIIMAAGYPRFEASLRSLGYDVIPLDVSEFEKMDGGLSCLSLRF